MDIEVAATRVQRLRRRYHESDGPFTDKISSNYEEDERIHSPRDDELPKQLFRQINRLKIDAIRQLQANR